MENEGNVHKCDGPFSDFLVRHLRDLGKVQDERERYFSIGEL